MSLSETLWATTGELWKFLPFSFSYIYILCNLYPKSYKETSCYYQWTDACSQILHFPWYRWSFPFYSFH